MKHRRSLSITVTVLLLSLLVSAFQPLSPSAWQTKVDAWVLETAAAGTTEFLVELTTQADLSRASTLESKAEKGLYVFETLRETARQTQGPMLETLKALGVEYRAYWIVNMFWVRGSIESVRALAERADVAHIYANPRVRLDEPVEKTVASPTPEAIEWNISLVNAPEVWAMGYTGQGVVVGGADTGYDWDHPAIKNQYRGWDGAQVDHDYNWYDATAVHSLTPVDPYGHGTHTMGTMVGDDGAGNQIGMAPGARWIGCRNMDDFGYGTPDTYITCYQFLMAPTDVQGNNPDPTKAVDVINNSWGCPVSEGCTDPNVLLAAVQAVRAAGILTAHSAGNSGSGCSTVDTPAAIYAESFTVGATTSGDVLASYSSRGPVTVDGSNRTKPDISAPGSSVRSCVPGTGYASMSGTSMAAPHVAGEVALLISALPGLRGQVDQMEDIIEQSALDKPVSNQCSSDGVPNNLYGWGRIDVLAAVMTNVHTLELLKTAVPDEIAPGQNITYTISLTHEHLTSPTLSVAISDTLPTGTSLISATEPYSLVDGVVRWDFTSLEAGESVQVELVVQSAITATGMIVNETYAASSEDVAAVYGAPVETTIVPFGLELAKEAPSQLAPGSPLTYTLSVVNSNPLSAQHALVLTDVVPLHTSFLTATQPYTLTDDVVTWQIPLLEAEGMWQTQLVVQTPLTYTGAVVNEQYGVRSLEVGTVTGEPVVTQLYLLGLGKAVSTGTVEPGFPLTYTLTVTNQNLDSLTSGVVLSDALPGGVEFVSATGNYTMTDGVVIWNLGDLNPGEAVQVLLVVRVNQDWRGWLVNADYAVWSEQVTEPVKGAPVSTWVAFPYVFRLPLTIKS